jgi:hypothetical protein
MTIEVALERAMLVDEVTRTALRKTVDRIVDEIYLDAHRAVTDGLQPRFQSLAKEIATDKSFGKRVRDMVAESILLTIRDHGLAEKWIAQEAPKIFDEAMEQARPILVEKLKAKLVGTLG